MKKEECNTKCLVLEVVKDGYRRLVHRTATAGGDRLFVEESDLLDFSRPTYETNDYNVFFTERAFWKSFTEYTSTEGLLNRNVWHQSMKEWLSLSPVFIHEDIKHLVQESLAEATREINSADAKQINGIRTWLRALAQPSNEIYNAINEPTKKYRYAV